MSSHPLLVSAVTPFPEMSQKSKTSDAVSKKNVGILARKSMAPAPAWSWWVKLRSWASHNPVSMSGVLGQFLDSRRKRLRI